MRFIIYLALTFSCTPAIAQQESTSVLPLQRRNEIGLLSDLGFSNQSNSGIGVQYKHWVRADKQAIRGNIAYSKYLNVNSKIHFPSLGDTIFSRQDMTDIPMVYAGAGIEQQRHFYKNVYMYAAIDVYAAYGRGTTKEFFEKEVTKNNENIYTEQYSGRTYNSGIFKIGLLPMVGVKFQFSRVSFGTELSGIKIEYAKLTHDNGLPSEKGVADFNMGSFTQRVFVNFRF